jgi:23S rRNA-/tRNA-specific pseudouridylate synthase
MLHFETCTKCNETFRTHKVGKKYCWLCVGSDPERNRKYYLNKKETMPQRRKTQITKEKDCEHCKTQFTAKKYSGSFAGYEKYCEECTAKKIWARNYKEGV